MSTKNIEINAIAALCPWTRSIGHYNGRLPWSRIKEDFLHFKRTTSGPRGQPGYPLIMGRKTFESLPGILPGRPHIIMSRDPNFSVDDLDTQDGDHGPMVVVVDSAEKALEEAARYESYAQRDPKVFIMGGGEIYRIFLGYTDKLILTKIRSKDLYEDIEAPVKFPPYHHCGFTNVIDSFKLNDPKYYCSVEVITRR